MSSQHHTYYLLSVWTTPKSIVATDLRQRMQIFTICTEFLHDPLTSIQSDVALEKHGRQWFEY